MVSIYWEIWTFLEIKKSLLNIWIHINSLDDYVNEIKKIEKEKLNIYLLSEERFKNYRDSKIADYHLNIKTLDDILYKIENWNILRNIILRFQLYFLRKKITELQLELTKLEKDKNKYLDEFSIQVERDIKNKIFTLESQKNNYYWALAEIEVQNHLKNLYIDSKLINNFSKYFSEAIPMKWWHDWIQSVQIDHILINKKWIFLIETKNWSKDSEKEIDFSPLYQAKRHSHAFYFYYKNIFIQRIGCIPKIYSIIAKKQSINSQYNQMYHVYEMNISQLNNFIQGRYDNINSTQVENILNILQ